MPKNKITRPSDKQSLRRPTTQQQLEEKNEGIKKQAKENTVMEDLAQALSKVTQIAVPDTHIAEKIDDIDLKIDDQLKTAKNTLGSIDDQYYQSVDINDNLSNLNRTSNDISAKLTTLSDRLKEKYEGSTVATEAPIEPTSSESLSERAAAAQDSVERDVPAPVDVEPQASSSLLERGGEQQVEGAPSAKGAVLVNAVTAVTGAITTGFKKSQSIADKISGMLFKFTVTQAVNAAKIALLIASIILAIDVLKIAWDAWGDKIMEVFDKWTTKFGEWWESFKGWADDFSDMRFALDGMQGDIMGIRNAWESGDFPALASAIGVAFVDGLKTLQGILDRLFTKIIATILNALGFKETAKAVEAEGLQRYQNMSNNPLSDENQKKLAEEQLRREEKDGLTPTQRGITSFLPDKLRNMAGVLSDDEMGQIEAEKKDQATRKSLSKDDQVANVAAANEAREAVARFKNVAENVNPNNKSDVEKADKYKKEAQQAIDNPALSLTPNIKAELQQQISASVKAVPLKSNVKPTKAAEAQDTIKANNIIASESARRQTSEQSPSSANISNTIVKSTRNIQMQSPMTSTRAPGIFGATKSN